MQQSVWLSVQQSVWLSVHRWCTNECSSQAILIHLLQISKQEFIEGYHKLVLLPPISPTSYTPVDDQTTNAKHREPAHSTREPAHSTPALSLCDDLGLPTTESIYHQISFTQNPFLRQVNTRALSCRSILGSCNGSRRVDERHSLTYIE